jgi:hypothetical protein
VEYTLTATNQQDLLERLRTLAIRQRMSPGVMHSAAPADFALLMAAAAHAFVPDRAYTESEVNECLRTWLAGAGAMLDVDHVELRRWLVDTGVLARDGFGRAYARGTPGVAIAAAIRALAGQDLAALARDARSAEAARRDARRKHWANKQGSPG